MRSSGGAPILLLVVVAGVLFGTAGAARALGPEGADPVAVGILRVQVGALALLLWAPFARVDPRRLVTRLRSPAIVVTALGAALYQPLFFGAVSEAGVALGTLVAVGSEPILAGLLGWFVLAHRPRPAWIVATAIAIAGLVLRAWEELGGGAGPGLLLALGAGLASAAYTVAAKAQLDRGVTPYEVTTASFLLGGLVLLPLLPGRDLGWVATPPGIALALYLGVATMAVANALLARGIHGLRPGPVATLMLTDPVVATLLGVVVLGERLGPLAAVGLAIVLAGLVLQGVALARERPRSEEPAPVL